MKNVVILHCFREVSFISITFDDLSYGIWSSALEVELLSWSGPSEVSNGETNFVPDFEGHVLSASIFRLLYLCHQQALPEKPMSLFQSRYLCIRQYFRPHIQSDFR